MSFRSKIFFSQFILFCVFILLVFFFIEKSVQRIVQRSLEESTEDLLQLVLPAKNLNEMIDELKKQEFFVFFRVSLLNEKGELLYDSHLPKRLGEQFIPLYPATHPEVEQALKNGVGYSEEYSTIFGQKFAYVASAFYFQGKKYILRTAFPYTQVEDLANNFQLGFLILAFFLLLLFSGMTAFIFYRLSRPVQKIIQTIRPYQEGKIDELPEIQIGPSLNENDDFSRLAKTLNSLSARIRLQIANLIDERNEKEAILESLGEGVIAVDANMHIRYINFIGSKMLGIPKRHLLGRPFPVNHDKAHSALLIKCRQLLEVCQQQGNILTDSLSLGEARKLYLDLIAAPKSQGTGAIIVLQDKSSHYKVLEMGKDFVANASHELRTPITIIRGFAETLQDLPEISREMLFDITEKIVRNCQRMDTLVKNLLTLADIENLPEKRFQECDILSLVENCRHYLLSLYPDAVVSIEGGEYCMIKADPDLLELAILNLFDNAAKYSKPPAQISVIIAEMADEVRVDISDKGMGIPPADLEHVFERFYTVNKAHSRRLGGAGLGLSIVKTIIEKHDGSISVSSTLGEGTTFTLFLPIYRR